MTSPPLDRLSIAAEELMRDHAPRFASENKRLVFDISSPPGSTHGGTLHYSRWGAHPPDPGQRVHGDVTVAVRHHFYDYRPELDGALDWHVNFADPQLFGFYHTTLFAQDEMQCAEHPALGALREALLERGLAPVTVEDGSATPVLVRGVERRCVVRTESNAEAGRPQGLYGNAFAGASPEAIRRATERIDPPTVSNIIAIAAPRYGSGAYSLDEIDAILTTATTGFSAAVHESRSGEAERPTVIHTGYWGCGAFGGNRVLMVMLQIVAAEIAGVDALVMHTGSRADAASYDEARERLGRLTSGGVRLGDLLRSVEQLGLRWGTSDGN